MIDLAPDARLPWVFRDDVLVLETPRHWMRWPIPADAELLARAGDELHASGLHGTTAVAPASAADWIGWTRQRNAHGAVLSLALTDKAGARAPVGFVGTTVERNGDLAVGVWIAPELRRQGRGGEAVAGVICALGLVSRPRTLFAEVDRDNPAGVKVLVRNGFADAADDKTTAPTVRLARSLKGACSDQWAPSARRKGAARIRAA